MDDAFEREKRRELRMDFGNEAHDWEDVALKHGPDRTYILGKPYRRGWWQRLRSWFRRHVLGHKYPDRMWGLPLSTELTYGIAVPSEGVMFARKIRGGKTAGRRTKRRAA